MIPMIKKGRELAKLGINDLPIKTASIFMATKKKQ
jgi:hypothetical protein